MYEIYCQLDDRFYRHYLPKKPTFFGHVRLLWEWYLEEKARAEEEARDAEELAEGLAEEDEEDEEYLRGIAEEIAAEVREARENHAYYPQSEPRDEDRRIG
jgi:hypothetical protein